MTRRLAFGAATIGIAGLCVMMVTLFQGAATGDLTAEGGELLAMPWGRATIADVYVGLALFSGWVVHREGRRWATAAWVAAVLVAGNAASCCYVLWALWRSRGDADDFWNGARHEA